MGTILITVNTLHSQSSGRGRGEQKFFTILWTIIQAAFENVQSNGFSGGTPKHGQIYYEMPYYNTTLTANMLDSQSSGRDRGEQKFF